MKTSAGNMIQLVSFAAAAVCTPNAHHCSGVGASAGALHLAVNDTLPPAYDHEMQNSFAASKQPSHEAPTGVEAATVATASALTSRDLDMVCAIVQ